jgi:hypothetical protein
LMGRHGFANNASHLLWRYGRHERLRGWCHGSRGFGLSSQRYRLASGLHRMLRSECLVSLRMLEGLWLLLKSHRRAFHRGSEGFSGRDLRPGLALADLAKLTTLSLLRLQRGVMLGICCPSCRAWWDWFGHRWAGGRLLGHADWLRWCLDNRGWRCDRLSLLLWVRESGRSQRVGWRDRLGGWLSALRQGLNGWSWRCYRR